MKTENLSALKIHKLSQKQFDRELAAGNIDETAMYLTPDEEPTLPAVTDEDNGKLLQVVGGVWSAVAITDGNEVAY
ncbi:MAG: hypothetical protein IJ370_04045 [Oscillospiraceae bacterium]|nr:hypothetical protein [Oscillospiraceae bacterium]MBQ8338543.1 hypothetical protein [Oscillospiraceae bacterium]